jgi:uncharacterized protein with ParB-like and HNH nuclease domain
MKVTQEPTTLDKVLDEFNFQVPLFQREYSWELEQVSDLFYDIDNSSEDGGHFLGSILLHSSESSKKLMEIIDGQQRLTTIFLILYSIKKALKNTEHTEAIQTINFLLYQRSKKLSVVNTSEEPRLVTGKRDKRLFRAILKGEEVDRHRDGRIKSHKLLVNALENFIDLKIEKLKTDKGIEGVIEFADKVIACEFIVMTSEKKSDKILLFKTLNARGIELSQADLIKNEICNSPKGISDEEAVFLWDEIREILEKEKANIDTFLFHFINSLSDAQLLRKKIDERRNLNKDKDSYPPVSEKYVFDVYDEKLKSISNTEEFLNSLKKAAQDYAEIYNPTDDKLHLIGLKTMTITKCYPLLLRGKDVLNKENFEKLTKAIECISFRHSILKNDPKDLEKFYYLVLNKLNSDDDIEIVLEDIRNHSTMKLKEKFESEFKYLAPKPSIAKMILDRIVRIQGESINWKSKDVHLEHIMPQNPRNAWLELKNSDKELYEFSLNRLGNLALLKDKLNQSASNKDFEVKKSEYYVKSRLKIISDITKFDKWDYNAIDERQAELWELSKEIWTF